MDLSVGEDQATFIEIIKNGEINKDTIPEDGDHNDSFLLCLLNFFSEKNLKKKIRTLWKHSG